jgi:AcrR family transcriptional regulator
MFIVMSPRSVPPHTSTSVPKPRAGRVRGGKGEAERPSNRPYGGMSGDDRRSERRARFIEAGIAAFGRDGFRGTTTRSVCAEAGLTQRYFYESFADLEALFLAVATSLGARLHEVLLAVDVRAGEDPRALLHSQLGRYFALLKADPAGARIMLLEVYTASTRVGELAMRFTEELGVLVSARIEAVFPHLVGRGLDAKLMATALVGSIHHLALRWMLSGYREPMGRIVDTATAVFMGAAFAVGSSAHERT